MKAAIESITPKTAEKMLERNGMNRPMRRSVWAKYAEDMRNGLWKLNGETVVVASDDELLDGQHRLKAITISGVTQRMLVVRGVDKSVFDTLDGGAARSAGDVLSLTGVKNGAVVASAARTARNHIEGLHIRGRIGRTTQTSFASANPKLSAICDLVVSSRTPVQSSTLAAVLFLANISGRMDAQMERFIDRLASGEGLKRGDPVHTLREWAMELRAKTKGSVVNSASLQFRAISRAWNAFVRDEQLLRFRFGGADETIHIEGYSPMNFRSAQAA